MLWFWQPAKPCTVHKPKREPEPPNNPALSWNARPCWAALCSICATTSTTLSLPCWAILICCCWNPAASRLRHARRLIRFATWRCAFMRSCSAFHRSRRKCTWSPYRPKGTRASRAWLWLADEASLLETAKERSRNSFLARELAEFVHRRRKLPFNPPPVIPILKEELRPLLTADGQLHCGEV